MRLFWLSKEANNIHRATNLSLKKVGKVHEISNLVHAAQKVANVIFTKKDMHVMILKTQDLGQKIIHTCQEIGLFWVSELH